MRSATNSETPRYRPLLLEPGLLGQIVSRLPTSQHRVSLSYLPAAEATPDRPRLAGKGVRLLSREIRRSPFVRTDGDFDAWEKDRLSRDRRSNLRRLRRRLGELGDIRFEVVNGADRLQDLLDEGLGLEASGWKGTAGTAVRARPEARRFYSDLAAGAAERGVLRLFFLRIDGRAVAFSLDIEDGSVLSRLKVAFDEDLRSYAPGVLLLRFGLEYCFDRPEVTRFDFLGEAERHKLEWTDDVEPQLQLELFTGGRGAAVEKLALSSAWAAREQARRRVPLEVRERLDLSSASAARRTIGAVVRARLAVGRPDRTASQQQGG